MTAEVLKKAVEILGLNIGDEIIVERVRNGKYLNLIICTVLDDYNIESRAGQKMDVEDILGMMSGNARFEKYELEERSFMNEFLKETGIDIQPGDIIQFEKDGVCAEISYCFYEDGCLYRHVGRDEICREATEMLYEGTPFRKVFQDEGPGSFYPRKNEKFWYIDEVGSIVPMEEDEKEGRQEARLRKILIENGVCFRDYWVAKKFKEEIEANRKF